MSTSGRCLPLRLLLERAIAKGGNLGGTVYPSPLPPSLRCLCALSGTFDYLNYDHSASHCLPLIDYRTFDNHFNLSAFHTFLSFIVAMKVLVVLPAVLTASQDNLP